MYNDLFFMMRMVITIVTISVTTIPDAMAASLKSLTVFDGFHVPVTGSHVLLSVTWFLSPNWYRTLCLLSDKVKLALRGTGG